MNGQLPAHTNSGTILLRGIIMKLLLITGSIIVPFLMVYIQYRWKGTRTLFSILMLICIIIAGDIAALSIWQVIKDNALFMTHIHGIFLNPLFIVTGAYIGVYTIYLIVLLIGEEWRGMIDTGKSYEIE